MRRARSRGNGLEAPCGLEGGLDGVDVVAEKNHGGVFAVSRFASGRDDAAFNGVEDASSRTTDFAAEFGGGYEFRVHTPVESVKFDRCSTIARPFRRGGPCVPRA